MPQTALNVLTVYHAHCKVLYLQKHGTELVANGAMVEVVALKLMSCRFDPQKCQEIFIVFSISLWLVPTLVTSGAVKRISYKTTESPIYNASYYMFIYGKPDWDYKVYEQIWVWKWVWLCQYAHKCMYDFVCKIDS